MTLIVMDKAACGNEVTWRVLITEKDCALLDAVQNRAARWVLKSRWDPESLRWTKFSSDYSVCIDSELAILIN